LGAGVWRNKEKVHREQATPSGDNLEGNRRHQGKIEECCQMAQIQENMYETSVELESILEISSVV
jgi:hypothetical protein